MTTLETGGGIPANPPIRYIKWGPAIAGALVAAALAFVLQTFAAAIGLAVTSTAPTLRDFSRALQLWGKYHCFRSGAAPAIRRPDICPCRGDSILLTSTRYSGVAGADRAYLTRLTAATTGLAPPDAEKRVDTVTGQARDNIRKARRAVVIIAFMAGAAALLGAAVAWFAAAAGGEHRDGRSAPAEFWGLRVRRAA